MRMHLVDRVEVVFHALDGNVLASLDALRLEHLREGTLSLFANEPVLYVLEQGRKQLLCIAKVFFLILI